MSKRSGRVFGAPALRRVTLVVDVVGDWAEEDVKDTLRAACEGRIARLPAPGDILYSSALVKSVRSKSVR